MRRVRGKPCIGSGNRALPSGIRPPAQSCDNDACKTALRQGTRLTRVGDSRAILSAVSLLCPCHAPCLFYLSVFVYAGFFEVYRIPEVEE